MIQGRIMNGFSQDYIKDFLHQYHHPLRESLIAGWHAWIELGQRVPELQHPLSAQCRARFVYDHIVNAAKERFEGLPQVLTSSTRGFLEIYFHEEGVHVCTVRFKKVNKKGQSSNLLTEQQRKWRYVEQLKFDFPELPPEAIRLIAGYRLDVLGTVQEELVITRPSGNDAIWKYEIPETDSLVVPFPSSGGEPGPGVNVRSTGEIEVPEEYTEDDE